LDIILNWTGPIGPGVFPEDHESLEVMQAPGVYLRVKVYDSDRIVGYVGQSQNVLSRIDQHLTGLLSLQQTVRDGTGRIVSRGDFADRLGAYKDIGSAMEMVAADAARMRFYVAFCHDDFEADWLNLVEGALKDRMEALAAQRAGLIDCENRQGITADPFEGVVRIETEASELAPEHARVVERLVGTETIEIAESVLGLGHAE
jgi:hypothetical protein